MKIVKGIAILENDTHIGKWVKQSGRLDHDQNMLPHVLKYIKKGDTVVDAGAFIGDHTIAYANAVGEEGNVYAFEPYQPAYECLVYNMQNHPQVKCINSGLSANWVTLNTICENNNIGMAYMDGEGNTDAVPLDNFGYERLDFLKIDVEGMELDVLRGAENTIKLHQPVMLIEINQATLNRKGISSNDVFDYLTSINYTFRNVYEGQGLNDAQFDILCFPK